MSVYVLIPEAQLCSAPRNLPVGIRPLARVTSIGSTYVSLEWDAPQLPSNCADQVFSFPPLLYGVFVHLVTPGSGITQVGCSETLYS